MKLKKNIIGLLMLAGVVVMFVVMPKQANAAADGNVVEQYATTVVSESNMKLNGSPFINFTRTVPGTKNWWRIVYNKWRHGKL